jgi:hypothetical protein
MADLTKLAKDVIESPSALLILLGSALVVVGAAGGISYNSWFTVGSSNGQIAICSFGALLAVSGLVLLLKPTNPLRRADYYGIKISYPRDGERIAGLVDVGGDIKRHPPSSYEMCLLRMYPSGDYMPVGRIQLRKGGRWEAKGVDIGGVKEDRREIGVYLVGPGGRKLLEYFSKAASEHGKARRKLVELKIDTGFLPLIHGETPDMLKCDSVHVVRD